MAHSYSSAKILSDPFSPTIAVCPGRVASKPVGLPSGNQMWQWEIHYKWRFQMGKSSIEWGIFHCHLWFPEAIHGFCTQIAWFLPIFLNDVLVSAEVFFPSCGNANFREDFRSNRWHQFLVCWWNQNENALTLIHNYFLPLWNPHFETSSTDIQFSFLLKSSGFDKFSHFSGWNLPLKPGEIPILVAEIPAKEGRGAGHRPGPPGGPSANRCPGG